MIVSSYTRRFNAWRIAQVLLLLSSLTAGVHGGQGWYDYGRVEVGNEPATKQGTWDGTWIHVNRDARIVLYVRTTSGKPEVRLQYQSTIAPEAFETDWDGNATYYLSGQTARFSLALDGRTPDEMSGTWDWSVDFADSGRTELGKFHLYRVDTGRRAVMRFDSWERQIRRGSTLQRFPATPSLGFTKVSKRLLLWDEIF